MPADFVGRAADLATLTDLCRTAARISAPVVGLVTAPPGHGKTRLLTEVCARVEAPERIWLGGYEAESAIPLAAARELLRCLSSGSEGVLVERLLGRSSGIAEPLQLFEAVVRAMSSRPGLDLVVDDLQWVDRSSLGLVHYAVRAAEATGFPLVLLAAARPTAGADRLGEAIAGVLSDPTRLVRLDLAPLDQAAGTALARSQAPGVGGPELDDIWRRAEGSPFWIEVLARERGGGRSPSALDRRLRAASGDAGVLLSLLAVLGRPVDRALIADLPEWPQDRAGDAVSDLSALGLATDDGTAVVVAHPIVRERLLDRLDPAAAKRLHGRVARWLSERATDDRALLEAVEHGRRAGVPMLRAALRLAESPQRRLLGSTGWEMLRAVADDADPAGAESAALDRALARLAAELGDHGRALTGWSAILARGTGPDRAAVALAAAESALHLDRAAEAERFLAQAARSAADDTRITAEIDALAAEVLLWLRHSADEGRVAATRAVGAARRLADRAGGTDLLSAVQRRAYVRAFLAGAEAASHADRTAEMLAMADELVAVATADEPRIRVRGLADGALALRWLGRNADAEARLRLAWEEVRREALPQATMEVGALLAKVLHSRGRLDEATDVVAECDRLGRRLAEFCPSRAFTPLIGHLVEASRGDWRRAAERLRTGVAAEPDPHYRAHVRLERALLLARFEPRRARDVRADVDAALADSAASGCRRCRLEVRARGAEALARVGDPAAASALLEDWDADPQNRALQLWGMQARAAILAARGDLSSAAQVWRDAVADADRCGFVLEGLWARIDLGQVLAAVDRPAAAALLRETGAIAEHCGARAELKAVEQGLRSLGVRTWRRTAGDPSSDLTSREREIAARVAAGESNAEVAAAMFLSRKTVERHVSNVLAKAGLRNRAELAAAWSAEGREPEGVHR